MNLIIISCSKKINDLPSLCLIGLPFSFTLPQFRLFWFFSFGEKRRRTMRGEKIIVEDLEASIEWSFAHYSRVFCLCKCRTSKAMERDKRNAYQVQDAMDDVGESPFEFLLATFRTVIRSIIWLALLFSLFIQLKMYKLRARAPSSRAFIDGCIVFWVRRKFHCGNGCHFWRAYKQEEVFSAFSEEARGRREDVGVDKGRGEESYERIWITCNEIIFKWKKGKTRKRNKKN